MAIHARARKQLMLGQEEERAIKDERTAVPPAGTFLPRRSPAARLFPGLPVRIVVAMLLALGPVCGIEREGNAARSAVNVTVPLSFSLGMIERGIRDRLFTGPQQTCSLVADEAGCRSFYLSSPQPYVRAGRWMLQAATN